MKEREKGLSYINRTHSSLNSQQRSLTAVCPEGWPSVSRSSLMLGPEVSAPILNLLHCCIRSEPSRDVIKKIDGL